ncbi:ribose import ATP-binding protein RbsA [Alicyclobacillus hesperidum subsp. aegles]|uniref:sugar ABC transporter ATP-binding protein n=1 Tax=Alicyclobacillus hesperidum TaxID=89784 RepID=UPI00222915F6|nr:sugar ABC transporter ATP-binding protein [Alicyclobacillus hesperidum]GLG02818.1 ribose import ATP-binding protein RbsA [Alicyclobacillus hesperidum subsp. aegles]
MLELQHVTKTFSGNRVLDDVSFTAYPGEVHALVGQNGAGKSTLMKILAGAYTADQGEILVDGDKIHIESPRDAEVNGISIVYQDLSLFPHLTVADNIVFGREPEGRLHLLDERRALTIAENALARLKVNIDPKRRIGTLNASEQQICEIAKVISRQPKIVILDEPTASLTKAETRALFDVMKAMKHEGLTLIFISHHMEEIFEIADRCTVLRDGRVVYTGAVSGIDERGIVGLMVGHNIGEFYPKRGGECSDVVALKLEGFGRDGIGPIDMEVRYGEILGIAGLVGSGRTELARMIFGADRYQFGTIKIAGEHVKINAPEDAIRFGVSLVTEDRRIDGLNLGMPIRFNITLPSVISRKRSLSKLEFIRKRHETELATRISEMVRVKCWSIEQPVSTLSGGNQQKVSIGKWVATNSKIYIFDEPTKGIDVASKAEIYKLINQLADEGAAVIVISSYNPELIGICNRILVMSRGRIVKELDNQATESDILFAESL